MDDYKVRPMKEEDIAQVEEIERGIFSLPWSYKSFLDAINAENNIYLICEVSGEIAGYCGMWTVLNEGNITNMAVMDKFRRRGIAGLLMKHMEELAVDKGVSIFFLEVRESNDKAIGLYTKMGYQDIGVRKNFYERPVENARVMSKSIIKTQDI